MNPNVSILITAYKTQDFIEQCLDSIISQTYFAINDKFEILLGIDHCPATLEKVNQIKHKYKNLRIFYMRENKGTYITVNTLIPLAKYDKIIKFDSDDIMIETLVHDVLSHSDNVDYILFSNYRFENNDLTKLTIRPPSEGVYCVDKKVFDVLGGFKPWICGADSDFLRRIPKQIKKGAIQKPLFYRRIHNNSLTNSKKTGQFSDLRLKYTQQLATKFEYVEPVVNQYDIIE